MAANIPDMGAINTLGGQFTQNIFEDAQKHFTKKSQTQARAARNIAKQTAANRQKFAQSATQGIKQGRTKFVQGQQQQQTAAKKAAAAHTAGVKSGRVAPAPGAAPRTFAMAPTPQAKAQAKQTATGAKTMQQQRNFAHGQALNYQAAQFRTQQSQKNYAHGQAVQQQKQMSNKATKGGPVNTSTPKAPSLSPAFSSAPTAQTPIKAKPIPSASFSSQLAPQKPFAGRQGTATASFSSASGNGSAQPSKAPSKPPVSSQFSSGPKASGGYPQHVPPAGSSTAPLPNLTANQPKPNTFTVGSRNAKPGGLAAKGSQLEAWAIGKQAEIKAKRGTDN